MFNARTAFPIPTTSLRGNTALNLLSKLAVEEIASRGVVTLSLAQVWDIDEAGVAGLVRYYSKVTANGMRLRLLDVRAEVAEVLDELGLGAVFGVQTVSPNAMPALALAA